MGTKEKLLACFKENQGLIFGEKRLPKNRLLVKHENGKIESLSSGIMSVRLS